MPLSKEKKVAYFARMKVMLASYTKVFVVKVDNVGSQQLNSTRKAMRGMAEILMGKNTMMRKVLTEYLEDKPKNHPLNKLFALCTGNIGFVFTNADLKEVRKLILANRIPAPARIGAIAPVNVVVPPGPTGCDPGQTSFFQVLQIPTKIVKGQIEITNSVDLIKVGQKVEAAEAALLKKLNIRPFSYGLSIECIYDNGSVFGVEILDIDDAIIISRFAGALRAVAAASLELGYPTLASLPHSIGRAFRSCVAVAVETGYDFPEAAPYKAYIANPAAFASAGPAAAAAAAPAAAAAAAPAAKKEEVVDALEGGMNMFGGGGGGDY